MPAAQRALVHELARHYNIPTCSYGNEPKRHIDLFRLPNSVAPLVKLSQVTAGFSHGEAGRGRPEGAVWGRAGESGFQLNSSTTLWC